MNLAMTSRMQQGEIIESVGAAFHLPDHVMGMPSGLRCDEVIAGRTTTTLSLPEYPIPSVEGFPHTALVAPLEVQFPSYIEWMSLRLDLDVSCDRNTTQLE